MGHLRRLFLILVFSTKLIVNNIANCWIWTADLWCWKRPLYQLSHNHYPIDNVCWVTMWCYPQYCVWHIVTTVGSYNCGIKSYIGQVLMIASFPQLIVALCIAHFLPKIVFSNFSLVATLSTFSTWVWHHCITSSSRCLSKPNYFLIIRLPCLHFLFFCNHWVQGPCWWWSGQRARLILLRSEFESRWSLQFFMLNLCLKRTKIKK